MRRRAGFTLIELLIVTLILGILASLALPKFAATRQRAHQRAVMSDLRNLNTQQELYFTLPVNRYNYAPALSDLPDLEVTPDVTIYITEATSQGWAATAGHAGLPASNFCAIYIGSTTTQPAFVPAPNQVTCTGL